jgi:hypothetical protein
MIKIFLTVRNRLAVTKKCIEALKKHSKLPHHIYVYNNQTNHLLKEHFNYFYELYNKKEISNISFTSDESNFNAFSKAVACNIFGHHHEEDPNKDKYKFLTFLDNDIIVAPEWDKIIDMAWDYVNKNRLDNIKIVGQIPGGIKFLEQEHPVTKSVKGSVGSLGGSGFWCVRSNFFKDVGYLPLKQLVGQNKRHDQLYWQLLGKNTNGKPYIMGLKTKLAFHCGYVAGSVCNTLTKNRVNPKKEELIKFQDNEDYIDKMSFEEFYNKVSVDQKVCNDW